MGLSNGADEIASCSHDQINHGRGNEATFTLWGNDMTLIANGLISGSDW